MYQVKIENTGPEGTRGYKLFRLTQAGGDELHQRMIDDVPFAELLTGIELQADEPVGELVRGVNEVPAPPAAGKKRNTTAGK